MRTAENLLRALQAFVAISDAHRGGEWRGRHQGADDLVGPPRVIKCEFERALQRAGTAAKVCFLEQISFFFSFKSIRANSSPTT
jgi:hypothetical protein